MLCCPHCSMLSTILNKLLYKFVYIDLSTAYNDGDEENVQKKSKTDLGSKRNITRVNV